MPRIIRQALYEKLRELPALREFQRDFEELSGLKLAFVDELGLRDDPGNDALPVCGCIRRFDQGRLMCARTRQAVLAMAGQKPACVPCDAGMSEVAVPLSISGMRAGYFVFCGISTRVPDQAMIRKARHLLLKNGIDLTEAELETRFSESPMISSAKLEAYQRIVHLAASHIALTVTDRLSDPDSAMPPSVLKACGFIRAKALQEDISLGDVARHSGCSEGHFSRLFHHATGFTFREYVTQVRVEHAKALLLSTARSVTEIAYESGFQSISQFHRVFQKVHGISPGKLRATRSA